MRFRLIEILKRNKTMENGILHFSFICDKRKPLSTGFIYHKPLEMVLVTLPTDKIAAIFEGFQQINYIFQSV